MATYKPANETEVYVSDGGYVCIKQKDLMYAEDQCVCLTPHQAEWLATLLPNYAFEASDIFNINEDESDVAKT
jgi:hypothetical protein